MGRTLAATGPKAADFTLRFSTKPLDLWWGLYYYGRRFYSPDIHIWRNNDPLGLKRTAGTNGIGENSTKRTRRAAELCERIPEWPYLTRG